MHKLNSLLINIDLYEPLSYEDLIKDWIFNVAYDVVSAEKESRKLAIFEIKDKANAYLFGNLDVILDMLYHKSINYCNWLKENNPYYITPPNNTYTINVYNREIIVTPELVLFVEFVQYVKKMEHYQSELEMSVDLYTEDYTNENNWYFTSFGILRDGTLIRILDQEEDEKLSRILYNLDCDDYELDYIDDWDLFDLMQPIAQDNRWGAIRKYIIHNFIKEDADSLDKLRTELVNNDFETMFQKLPQMVNRMLIVNTYLFMKKILLENREHMPTEIVDSLNDYGHLGQFETLLQNFVGRDLGDITPQRSIDNSLKSQMKILKSIQYCNYPPFSVLYQKPESSWSSFDYRRNTEDLDVSEDTAIVFFDVHY